VAKSRCRCEPLRAIWNTIAPSTAEIASSVPASAKLTEAMKQIDSISATVGGITFHAMVFSSVKAALAVEEIRLASAPGRRSAK
jgi:hypothetical protein